MTITRCLHVALLVTDLPQAEHFYGTVLGLKKIDRALRFPGAWYEVGGFQIHLMTADTIADSLYNPDKWGRNPHIAFLVENLDDAKARLLDSGCPMQVSASGRAALFTRDPDGNVIELSQG
ncbi:VOC family protein [Leptolyngbya sp. FACHB-36]|uniref:VOC family protein n=1 Tax=Leptolyngbya sp. FACHB-36 TaxID=2692808 RepID=UPI001680C1CB|nr:VOC family protein [Leptolyngbya sp. FACHB-36]MBD2020291.1 VOC family protein [Leptolyngbya sp. FACHB-36]